MNQRIFALALCAMLFALCPCASAQQPKKVPRIGYLSAADPARESARSEAIRLALRELGYIVGQNIAIEYRYLEEKVVRAPELAAELVRLKVDIIVVAGGTEEVRAVKNATKTIPIVMTGSGLDPVEAGLVESLARPGGNVTGLTSLNRELGGKRLELLKEGVPKVARVAVLSEKANRLSVIEVKEVLPVAARALGLTVRSWEVQAADGFDRVFAALNKDRPDGLFVTGGTLMIANQKRIAGFALKSRLPSMYVRREFVDAGGLMSLRGGPSGQLPARRILRGQDPEGSQARRSAGGTAEEVRVRDQSEDSKTDWSDDSAERAGAGGQSDQMIAISGPFDFTQDRLDQTSDVRGDSKRTALRRSLFALYWQRARIIIQDPDF